MRPNARLQSELMRTQIDLNQIFNSNQTLNFFSSESFGKEFISSQAELFRIIPISVSDPMPFNLYQSESLRTLIHSLKIYFGFVRFHSYRSFQLSRVNFSSVFQQMRFFNFFGLVWIEFGLNSYPKYSPGFFR